MSTSLHSAARALAHRGKYARASIGTTGTDRYVKRTTLRSAMFSIPSSDISVCGSVWKWVRANSLAAQTSDCSDFNLRRGREGVSSSCRPWRAGWELCRRGLYLTMFERDLDLPIQTLESYSPKPEYPHHAVRSAGRCQEHRTDGWVLVVVFLLITDLLAAQKSCGHNC